LTANNGPKNLTVSTYVVSDFFFGVMFLSISESSRSTMVSI